MTQQIITLKNCCSTLCCLLLTQHKKKSLESYAAASLPSAPLVRPVIQFDWLILSRLRRLIPAGAPVLIGMM